MDLKIPVVVHKEYGAFHLTGEMVRRLKERGVAWVDKCSNCSSTDEYFLPSEGDTDHLRRDPHLVEVVRELTDEFEKLVDQKDVVTSWKRRADLRRKMLANLCVVDVTVAIEIEDFDGKESVRVTGGEW